MQALQSSALMEGHKRRLDLEGRSVLILRKNGIVFAIDANCHHMQADLSMGDIEDGPMNHACVRCPMHKRLISLHDGTYFDELQGCAKPNHQRVYATEERADGYIWIQLPEASSLGAYVSDAATLQPRTIMQGQANTLMAQGMRARRAAMAAAMQKRKIQPPTAAPTVPATPFPTPPPQPAHSPPVTQPSPGHLKQTRLSEFFLKPSSMENGVAPMME